MLSMLRLLLLFSFLFVPSRVCTNIARLRSYASHFHSIEARLADPITEEVLNYRQVSFIARTCEYS
jgi:hypothetical protein